MIIEPTTAGRISQSYGTRPGYWDAALGRYVGLNPVGGHTANDRAAPLGTPLVAMADGDVVQAGVMQGEYWQNKFWIMGDRAGKSVIIRHWFGWTTLSHCQDVYVVPGQYVRQGDVVASLGSSGASTGPHVHYEILLNGFNVAGPTYGRSNPNLYLSAAVRASGAITPTTTEEDTMNKAQEELLARAVQVLEAQETDRMRERIIAIDDRTATAITRYVKGDADATVYEDQDGVLRPVTLDEFTLSMGKGELYRTFPQAWVDRMPKVPVTT